MGDVRARVRDTRRRQACGAGQGPDCGAVVFEGGGLLFTEDAARRGPVESCAELPPCPEGGTCPAAGGDLGHRRTDPAPAITAPSGARWRWVARFDGLADVESLPYSFTIAQLEAYERASHFLATHGEAFTGIELRRVPVTVH